MFSIIAKLYAAFMSSILLIAAICFFGGLGLLILGTDCSGSSPMPPQLGDWENTVAVSLFGVSEWLLIKGIIIGFWVGIWGFIPCLLLGGLISLFTYHSSEKGR